MKKAVDWTAVKVWIANQLADLCEVLHDDGAIIEIATIASNMLKERRERQKDGN